MSDRKHLNGSRTCKLSLKVDLLLTADLFTILRSVRLGTTSDIMNVSSMKASELQSVICWKENLNVPQLLGKLNIILIFTLRAVVFPGRTPCYEGRKTTASDHLLFHQAYTST